MTQATARTRGGPEDRTRGGPEDDYDDPLMMPVSRTIDWDAVHRMSQAPDERGPIAVIRRSAVIRRGTRLIKFLTADQLAGLLHGWLIGGFCYRVRDVAHLRTPADLAVLTGQRDADVTYAVRWRAVDASDYEVPLSTTYGGLVSMPSHDRVGPPVIGSGFAPAERHIIPEFVTADLADLPVPAGASLVAFTPDGTEVVLYRYLPEQRSWVRMHGPQWRFLTENIHFPGGGGPVPVYQEYFPVPAGTTAYIGTHQGSTFEAIVDPPADFRVAAKFPAARFPLDTLARRLSYATWRGSRWTVVRAETNWLRLRLCRPDAVQVTTAGAHCVERGLYESWAPAAETTVDEIVVPYDL
jgi:hypothetical protein